MPKPILTVAIPAYNVELFIEETVLTLVKSKYSDKLEILIINDGSSDKTAEVSQSLAEQYQCVKVINKKNGGHGSAINAGLKNATGTYFRLLDGDDWFDTEEFDKFLSYLETETVDLVLTDYVECFIKSNFRRPVSYYSNLPEKTTLDLSTINFSEWGATLPTTTIKTSLLRSFNLTIDEHCFYVDQEYNFACYLCAKTAKYYPLMVYQYRLERDGQSMERASLIKNVNSHEKVCTHILSEYKKLDAEMPAVKKDYISSHIIIPMCHMQYTIANEYCKSTKQFLSFDHKLKKYPLFYNNPGIAGNIINFHRKTKGIFVKFTNIINSLIAHRNQKINKFLYLLIVVIILNLVIIILNKTTTIFNSPVINDIYETLVPSVDAFKSGMLSGLATLCNNLSLNHGAIMLAPTIPLLLLFGTTKTMFAISLFNLYVILPSLFFTFSTRALLTRIHLDKLAKLLIPPFLAFCVITALLLNPSLINPFGTLILSILLYYLIRTKLECISHFLIFAIILSFLTFSIPFLAPYIIAIFYIILFLALSAYKFRRMPNKKIKYIKIVKLFLKFTMSFVLYFILCQIA